MARFEDNIRIDSATALFGLLGAFVSLKHAKQTSTIGTVFSLTGGTVTAVALTPFITEHVSFLASQGGRNATAFVVGLFGMNFVAWLSNWIEKNGWQGVIEVLARRGKK